MSVKFDDTEVRNWINNQSSRERATRQVAEVVAAESTKNLLARYKSIQTTGELGNKTADKTDQ